LRIPLSIASKQFKYEIDRLSFAIIYTGNNFPLFTCDNNDNGKGQKRFTCAKIPGVYSTVGFAPFSNVKKSFDLMSLFNEGGPPFNSEYHPARVDHWGHPKTVEPEQWASTLDEILALNASVSFFVFHGGTAFGFKNAGGRDK
jgi:hypothetical protein